MAFVKYNIACAHHQCCASRSLHGTATRRCVAAFAEPKKVLKQLSHGESVSETDGELHDFDYMFSNIVDDPGKHLPASSITVDALNDLGDAMVEQTQISNDPPSNSPIPPIYTYWGQFVDHDMTANTDVNNEVSDITKDNIEPLPPAFVKENLKNMRQPYLNLDSVYGDGPDDDFVKYEGIKLILGKVSVAEGIPGVRIPPEDDLDRDLLRDKNGKAFIGDARNDENLVVAQLHVAFIRFHNAAVDWVERRHPEKTSKEVFVLARNFTMWSYQWVVVHDYLKTITLNGVVDDVLAGDDLLQLESRGTYMPLEFSVAAYRFGHSMVRPSYDWNSNFGRLGSVKPLATFDELFQFTGKADPTFGGTGNELPFNWIAEWDRMVDKNSSFPDRFSRRIDTVIAPPLTAMLNEGNNQGTTKRINKLLKQLARRNLLRGYLLSLPTGQAVAKELNIENPFTGKEITDKSNDQVNNALSKGKFVDNTPLWFYVLKESEVREQGNSLGEVGSRIVAGTIIAHLKNDPNSYINQSDWSPAKGVELPNGDPVLSIKDFLRFGGVLE